jgi:hypothetical protein
MAPNIQLFGTVGQDGSTLQTGAGRGGGAPLAGACA